MDRFVIHGGRPLRGEVVISGAKNAVVAILPATVLARGRCVIENVPGISDVATHIRILRHLGASVRYLDATTLEIDTSELTGCEVPHELAKTMRASYYYLGALVGRFGEAHVSMPGGCFLGVRPIDQHIKGFEALGAEMYIDSGMIHLCTPSAMGAHIHFDVVSVGATVNVMLSAVRAGGVTILENVAKEPHIVDLANCLNSMGADIRGAGTDVIKIHGVDMLRPTHYSIIPDQIEAGTYMVMAAATGGDVLIKNVIPKHMESITDKLLAAGSEVQLYDDSLRVIGHPPAERVNLMSMPHPGFPTDMQPQMVAMLATANGTSIVTEGVWEARFRYVEELKRMGACIQVNGKVCVVEGVGQLTGAPVTATDLRAGAALVIAALTANGVTEIEQIEHIERGYQGIVEKLTGLGAKISRISEPASLRAQAL